VSTKDRQVVRNLTPGFSKDRKYEFISVPGARWNTVPWMAWAPRGDRLAYFARTEKHRSLILINVVTGDIEERAYLDSVDVPESPEFSLDGRKVYFSALRDAVGDIFEVDLETREVRNLTNDVFADYAPTISPDGNTLVYLAGSAVTTSCSGSTWPPARRRSSRSARTTKAAHSTSMRTRWSSPRRRPIRPPWWTRRPCATGRSSICGRSTCATANCGSTPTRSPASSRPS
jgi:hypothetical protein